MTEEIGWASLGIVPTLDRGFGSKLDRQLDPSLSRVGSSAGHKFGSILGKAAVATSAGIIGAGFAAFRLGKAAFGEAEESLKVGALTESQIKATGGAANVSAKEVGNLANQLSRKAAIDDETIQSGENLLLTFKNVRNEVGKGNKIFNKASKATLDLAATMAASSGGDIDLKAASIQVGKALNDPIKGITALGRVGVQFTDQQKDQIKTLVEQGDLLGAQKIILGELNGEMKGAAASQATSWDRLGVAWKNAEEKLGNSLLPVIQDVSKFLRREGIPVVDGWIDSFDKKGVPALKHFYDKAKPVVEDVLPKFASLLGTVKDDLAIAAPFAKDFVDAFVGMPDWAKKVIIGGGLAAFAGKKLGVGSLLGGGKGAGGLVGLVSKARPIPVFVVNNGVGTGIPDKGSKIPKGVGAVALTAALRASPLLLPLLTKGDAAPEILTDDQAKLKKAWVTLYKETGTDSGEALNAALKGATRKQLADLQKTLKSETGLTLRAFGRLAEAGSKTGFKFGGLGLKEKNRADETLRSQLFQRTEFGDILTKIPTKVETKFFNTDLTKTTADVDKLIKMYDLHLDRREIKSLYTLLGVDEAETKIERLRRLAMSPLNAPLIVDGAGASHSILGGHSQSAPGEAPASRRGVTINIDKMVAHDYRDMQRQLQNRAQQASIGGIGILS